MDDTPVRGRGVRGGHDNPKRQQTQENTSVKTAAKRRVHG
jgi:hypothetical protein